MKTITAVEPLPSSGPQCLFLGGGITDCPDWQAEALQQLSLSGKAMAVLNPRRPDFPIGDREAGSQQIAWEWHGLRQANVILFWFAAEQIQPIALFELGAWSKSAKRIAVGTDPEYSRRFDVVEQMALERPALTVHETLFATVADAEMLLP